MKFEIFDSHGAIPSYSIAAIRYWFIGFLTSMIPLYQKLFEDQKNKLLSLIYGMETWLQSTSTDWEIWYGSNLWSLPNWTLLLGHLIGDRIEHPRGRASRHVCILIPVWSTCNKIQSPLLIAYSKASPRRLLFMRAKL